MNSSLAVFLTAVVFNIALLGCQSPGSGPAGRTSATSATSDDAPAGASGGASRPDAKIDRFLGSWVTDAGDTFELTPKRMKRVTKKLAETGAHPMEGRYDIVSLEDDVLVITPFLELSQGKEFKGDDQRLTLKDGRLDVRNVKNGSGDTYKRAQ